MMITPTECLGLITSTVHQQSLTSGMTFGMMIIGMTFLMMALLSNSSSIKRCRRYLVETKQYGKFKEWEEQKKREDN